MNLHSLNISQFFQRILIVEGPRHFSIVSIHRRRPFWCTGLPRCFEDDPRCLSEWVLVSRCWRGGCLFWSLFLWTTWGFLWWVLSDPVRYEVILLLIRFLWVRIVRFWSWMFGRLRIHLLNLLADELIVNRLFIGTAVFCCDVHSIFQFLLRWCTFYLLLHL